MTSYPAKRRWSIHNQLYALVLAVAMPLIGLMAYTIYSNTKNEIRQASTEAVGLARITAKHAEELLDITRQLLARLAQRPLVYALDPATCDPLLSRLLELHPDFANIITTNLAGEVVCSVAPVSKEKFGFLPASDWFKEVVREDRFAVSGPSIGPATDKWISMQGYPLHDKSGQMIGVVALSTELANYQPPISTVTIQPGTMFAIIDGNSLIISRFPEPEKWVGKSLKGTAIAKIVLSQKEGQARAVSADGSEKVYGFTPIPGSGWYAIGAIPSEVVFAAARKLAISSSVSALAIVLALAAIAWVLSRRITEPVRRIAEAAQAVSQGSVDVRVTPEGPAEIAAVATRFNEMLDARKLAEDTLRKSEGRFRATFNQAAVGISHLAPDGRWLRVNDKLCSMLGYSRDELLARSCADITHFDDIEKTLDNMSKLVADEVQPLSTEVRYTRKDGLIIWINATVSLVRDASGTPDYFIAVSEDITERKNADDALRTTSDRLQVLSQRLLEVQETERRHIARELHDEIGQALMAIKLELQAAALCQTAGTPPPRQLETCIRIADRVLGQVRSLSLDLRPPQLDTLGLVAALRWQLDRQAHAAGLTTYFAADSLPSQRNSDLETACFRVGQEAVTNVVRHAHASHIWVELRRRGAELHLLIRDDGKGFDAAGALEHALKGGSMGLLSMQERAMLAGGRLDIDSKPNIGTTIYAIFLLPVTGPEHQPTYEEAYV